MILVDKKIISGGISMICVGLVLSLYLNSITPIGTSGMSDDEKIDLLMKQQETNDLNTLTGILMGVGFLLILISFGARPKKKGGAKKVEKKPSID